MIAYLRGAYTELTPTAVLVECAGVGYSVAISLTTYTALSGQKEGKILITEIIREDAHLSTASPRRLSKISSVT